mgnify:CR=1 FL=1
MTRLTVAALLLGEEGRAVSKGKFITTCVGVSRLRSKLQWKPL